MSIQRACDVCKFYRPSVETFGLRRQIPRGKIDGVLHWTTAGAGSLELCDECWSKIGKPKMRPDKKDSFKWRGKSCASRG
jgi:hypothetical protein